MSTSNNNGCDYVETEYTLRIRLNNEEETFGSSSGESGDNDDVGADKTKDYNYNLFVRELIRRSGRNDVSSSSAAADTSSSSNDVHDDEIVHPSYIVIVIHGGPGIGDHSESYPGLKHLLSSFDDVANIDGEMTDKNADDDQGQGGRRTIHLIHGMYFYDQLGCGKSDKPDLSLPTNETGNNDNDDGGNSNRKSSSLYSLRYYVYELDQVIGHVKERHPNQKICLLGHSWGGQIVLEYLLQSSMSTAKSTSPCSYNNRKDVSCSIISNTPLDETTYERKQMLLRNQLDIDVRQYYELEEEENYRNVLKVIRRSGNSSVGKDMERDANDSSSSSSSNIDNIVGQCIYYKLIGKSETNITGELQGWSAMSRLLLLQQHIERSSKSSASSWYPPPPILLICSEDDTVEQEDYLKLQQQLRLNEDQQPRRREEQQYHLPQADEKEGDQEIVDLSCSYRFDSSQLRVVVLSEGAGHGPFFGPSSTTYFQHIHKFLRNTARTPF